MAGALGFCILWSAYSYGDTTTVENALSPYMNSIPPSKDYLCVGTGSTAQILHPDRAPHTDLAMQGSVVLFSGAAPQQGLNFTLPVGSMVYRNQMSTLGSAEPPPQVGTAGMLLQKPWSKDFLPWTEARWHPGEDISWRGYRSKCWLGGTPFWQYSKVGLVHEPQHGLCDNSCLPSTCGLAAPRLQPHYNGCDDSGVDIRLRHAASLLLLPGIYQVTKPALELFGLDLDDCPETFRDPWFQGRGSSPPAHAQLYAPKTPNGAAPIGPLRIAQDFAPNFLDIYPFESLTLDGGRLKMDFERSAVWPREKPIVNVVGSGNDWRGTMTGGGSNGTAMASRAMDEYLNTIEFDRVPDYGWQTDFKVPTAGVHHLSGDAIFTKLPSRHYEPEPNAWRLPHKRLRTVRLFDNAFQSSPGSLEYPTWTIAFIYEHPESDHIADTDAPTSVSSNTNPPVGWSPSDERRSLYSALPQAGWSFGPIPDLSDATTLLTIQAYKQDPQGEEYGYFNGAPFQDDLFLWASDGTRPNKARTILPSDSYGATVGSYDGCPGLCGTNDNAADGDTRTDEDSNGYRPYLSASDCTACQNAISTNQAIPSSCTETYISSGGCLNPLYWRGERVGTSWNSLASTKGLMDPFTSWDDDEDGLIDEDGPDDPLLVHMRAISDSDECAIGKHPFLPMGGVLQSQPISTHCLSPYEADSDPWTYQVQYVYARSNPYWLLRRRTTPAADASSAPRILSENAQQLKEPVYYYYPPFTEPYWDNNANGERDTSEPYIELNGDNQFSDFAGNIHADCVPHPSFRGPQGMDENDISVDPAKPSGINLIKRIVRMRADVENAPNNFTEQTWLYRYNDIGFLKAVFDPADVQAIIDINPSDTIKEPDDILKLGDAHNLAGKPLLMYASQWYTFYNPYAAPSNVAATDQQKGLPQCYEVPPKTLVCDPTESADPDDPSFSLPANACDGEALWQENYQAELHVDPDCSTFFKQNCGWCYARNYCSVDQCADEEFCQCEQSINYSDDQLRQMGVPDAQPRFRKWMIKTARMRGGDGNMHLYRLDYLGAAGGAYEYSASTTAPHISSYADAHNITIVDEIVEQAGEELTGETAKRNDFYIYEDDFAVDLDSGDSLGIADRPRDYGNTNQFRSASNRLEFPAKVKTRRIVVMNYYGIAMSDRLILTPGFDGTQTSFVDNQQFELINKRGQALHVFDPSWVAAWRTRGNSDPYGEAKVADTGRVLTQLYGGHEGWYSVLSGIAKGSKGGNLYDQQCKTSEVRNEVPVQRVTPEQLTVIRATDHFDRHPNGQIAAVQDMPSLEVIYSEPISASNSGFVYTDGSKLLGSDYCFAPDVDHDNDPGTPNADIHGGVDVDLSVQTPVEITALPKSGGAAGDGASTIRHHYVFHGPADENQRVKWKVSWQEAVPNGQGGTGTQTALEVVFFDTDGRLRLQGQGAGTMYTPSTPPVPPTPIYPFTFTYFGFDDLGRQNLRVDDFDVSLAPNFLGGAYQAGYSFSPPNTNGPSSPLAPANIVTYGKFNDFGALISQCVGKQTTLSAPASSSPTWQPDTWAEVLRTDFLTVGNNVITHTGSDAKAIVEWRDPYSYQFVYQGVETIGGEDRVEGTTTVSIFDKGMRPIEQRIVAWNDARKNSGDSMLEKIKDFGWGVSAGNYTSDQAVANWGTSQTTIPYSNWVNYSTPTQWSGYWSSHFNAGPGGTQSGSFTPPHPDGSAGTISNWVPDPKDQIVTLARTSKRYTQASTLKPTQDVVYRKFDTAGPASGEDPREVTRRYNYDLEDRVARQKDPDGGITRLLYDAKRRPTKIYKGSADGCSNWFPAVSSGADDMILTAQTLYNDGEEICEFSDPFADSAAGCAAGSNQPTGYNDFPYDANKPVRTRRFTDSPDTCDLPLNPNTRSRDTQIVYDWRGRPVITREVAVGYGNNFATPEVVSVTAVIFDNLSRPVMVATWAPSNAPVLDDIERVGGWGD